MSEEATQVETISAIKLEVVCAEMALIWSSSLDLRRYPHASRTQESTSSSP
jgi:hypothetical protein